MLYIIYYKIPGVFYNLFNNMAEVIKSMRPLCVYSLCPDWKLCSSVITLMYISYLSAILLGCVSARLPGTQCKFINLYASVVFCTYVLYYSYKLGEKSRGTTSNGCVSPRWFSIPALYAIDTLCYIRSVSPCMHGTECICFIHCTGTICCMCVGYNCYELFQKNRCALPNRCVSPCGCSTSDGYYLSYHTN